jgi:hypothetical protein
MPDTSLDLGKTNILLKFNEPASRRQAIELIQGLVGPCAFGLQGVEMFVSKPLNTNQFRPSQVILEVDKRPTPREIVEFFDRNGGGSGSLRIKTVGSNSYQISTPVCAAADYLAWSDRFRGDFDLIRKALERPYVRMDGDYHDPLTIPLPNFVAFRTVAQTLAQRAQCYLLLGQPEGAVQELTQLRDLCRVLEGAPTGKPMTLVAAMINVVINGGLYADVIADGLRLHAWQEPQLVLLQKQLGQINLGPCMVESFRAERACAWRTMQTNVLAKLAVQRPNATLWQKMRNLRPPNIVKGFFFFNMVTIAKLHQDLIDSIDPVHKTVVPRRIGEFEREQETLGRHFSPYTFYAVIMIPNFANAVRTFACNQTRIHQAKTACALELYRSKRGEYPERLDELAPQTISELPQDIVGGRGLKYRRTSDGDFLLYSIGWNETDDGGEICSSSPGGGDWVWP